MWCGVDDHEYPQPSALCTTHYFWDSFLSCHKVILSSSFCLCHLFTPFHFSFPVANTRSPFLVYDVFKESRLRKYLFPICGRPVHFVSCNLYEHPVLFESCNIKLVGYPILDVAINSTFCWVFVIVLTIYTLTSSSLLSKRVNWAYIIEKKSHNASCFVTVCLLIERLTMRNYGETPCPYPGRVESMVLASILFIGQFALGGWSSQYVGYHYFPVPLFLVSISGWVDPEVEVSCLYISSNRRSTPWPRGQHSGMVATT